MRLEKAKREVNHSSHNWLLRRLSLQTLLIGSAQLGTILLLSTYTDILRVSSFWTALGATVIYSLSQWACWYCFIRFFAGFHPFFYPVIIALISGVFVMIATTVIPGFSVPTLLNGIETVCILTIASTLAAVIFGMDDDRWFAFNVMRAIVKRYGKAKQTKKPGFIFLEIDGLSYDVLKKAIARGYMPTLTRWLHKSHTLVHWETDLSSQTAAMQAGILEGNNTDVPAYRWYDRIKRRVVNSANPRDTMETEARLSTGHGLLEHGGASRGNMFSGDATENLFTYSTLFDPKRGTSPKFYLFLLNPYIASRIFTKFFLEMLFEVKDGIKQWLFDRRPSNISRAFPYPLVRAFMNSLLPEIITYTASIDVFRGIPAMYLLYPGYDDLAHFSGIDRPDSLRALATTDAWFAKLERIIEEAPRPYYITVLSDHGQSEGVHFQKKYGIGLKELIESLLAENINVYASIESNEERYLVNSVLTDAVRNHPRTSRLLKKTLGSRMADGRYIDVGPTTTEKDKEIIGSEKNADLIVLASGCLGLIYAANTEKRATYEQIEKLFPGFLQGLANHKGIGFVMVHSKKHGGMVIGKHGTYFLKTGNTQGKNPLLPYGPHAPRHLLTVDTFSNAPDVLVNASYDEKTNTISGFEKQVGHHGGLGGYQTRPFLLYPKELPVQDTIIGAVDLYRVLHGWRSNTEEHHQNSMSPLG